MKRLFMLFSRLIQNFSDLLMFNAPIKKAKTKTWPVYKDMRQRRPLANLSRLEKELEDCYRLVQEGSLERETEAFYLRRIRVMEDKRFQLLSEINGHDLRGYNSAPNNSISNQANKS